MSENNKTIFDTFTGKETTGQRPDSSESIFPIHTVLFPREMAEKRYTGQLYGLVAEGGEFYNILPEGLHMGGMPGVENLGEILADGGSANDSITRRKRSLVGRWEADGRLNLQIKGCPYIPVEVQYHDGLKDVFSRNTGIVNGDVLKKIKVLIAGLGSGGGYIATLLAKSGVENFILADPDIFYWHNVGRHVCDIREIGMNKARAMSQRLRWINPSIKAVCWEREIQRTDPVGFREAIDENTILISCVDNHSTNYYLNQLSEQYKIPFISAGCSALAATGEIFWYVPGQGMPCYECVYGEDKGLDMGGRKKLKYYADEWQLEKADFYPGMAVDIDRVSQFVTKLALDLMLCREDGYKPRLLPYVSQHILLYNYEVDEEINPLMGFLKGQKPMSWMCGEAEKKKGCTLCKELYQFR